MSSFVCLRLSRPKHVYLQSRVGIAPREHPSGQKWWGLGTRLVAILVWARLRSNSGDFGHLFCDVAQSVAKVVRPDSTSIGRLLPMLGRNPADLGQSQLWSDIARQRMTLIDSFVCLLTVYFFCTRAACAPSEQGVCALRAACVRPQSCMCAVRAARARERVLPPPRRESSGRLGASCVFARRRSRRVACGCGVGTGLHRHLLLQHHAHRLPSDRALLCRLAHFGYTRHQYE